ncbi:YifB family Mg chelatase-like AAA ATPase [Alicyclobacillus sp. SO9]|uniref:YifB family Mg chelatase-like AAA ATPase n=1 Tax=Alicyclobacillus sp. SO9 TaxID=2665646 RepID=UPI0018E83202|nr:YifB family Mg chelatase-like AAA ATPase [Alicyclobacillus sp. SO9]QQE80790.1 YifB family Mg chelatase-like AAA ATPase [Alicyclobacillus sp. SO9]
MIGTASGAVLDGIGAQIVQVEADVTRGLPQFSIVGLPDSAVTESKLRIRSAIRNSGMEFPQQRITVNLWPASVRKRGAGLDLAIAVAILRASLQIPNQPALRTAFCGELGLSGKIVPVDGIINLALELRRNAVNSLYFSSEQAAAGLKIPPLRWHVVSTLQELIDDLVSPSPARILQFSNTLFHDSDSKQDMQDVVGLTNIKRALMIAAAGKHHTLIVGPPGCGKTMLAERFATILPGISDEEAIESYAILQSAGIKTMPSHRPPLRMPHHSLTTTGLIGGGNFIQPGEVTLAHHGILVLDELLEFRKKTLEALREPLVHKQIRLSRGGHHTVLPANFQLIGTLNPCSCGYYGSTSCRCTERDVTRYWSTLSGPLLDRIDMVLSIPPRQDTVDKAQGEPSKTLRQQVVQAQNLLLRKQHRTLQSSSNFLEKTLLFDFTRQAQALLQRMEDKLHVSKRGIASIEHVAQSIAAVEGEERVSIEHVEEAAALRMGFKI